ncbi:MAG: hypothetical protein OER22_09065 [Gammaproteobacteria bacterium]|nr:hypothetical protein [Gammaproteobacteria bacterium]MDH3374947.1 hypothetical protein [Gammaproteobacteria bacterium]MDH3408105.1 hypothetical protein [Gammaproteobacteria bacterium]MDH3552748.1 hypothetical protein [Gammaproteobacteria bacterium]
MKLRFIFTALMLSLALTAAADFRTIVEGYEVALDNVRLPQTESGTIAFKKCSECPYETKRVAADATWEVNGAAMTLKDFRLRMSSLSEPGNRTITVGHHLEKDEIVRVTIWIY